VVPSPGSPLVYLTYSRLDLEGADPVAVARLLLEAGADPNAGYLWDGLPSPFTALTGVFGHGEQGAPAHRCELALARLLLHAGAEANDSQTIYNRGAGDIAHDDTDFLALLLDFGLGQGDGGPWRSRLPLEHQTPTEIVGEALQHAAEAGLISRARLLVARGVDPNGKGTRPGYQGRRPYEGALLHGNLEIAALLALAGADTTVAEPLTPFIGLCLAADDDDAHDALAADNRLWNGPKPNGPTWSLGPSNWAAPMQYGSSSTLASRSTPGAARPPCTRPHYAATSPWSSPNRTCVLLTGAARSTR
jgi:hypothetical protein